MLIGQTELFSFESQPVLKADSEFKMSLKRNVFYQAILSLKHSLLLQLQYMCFLNDTKCFMGLMIMILYEVQYGYVTRIQHITQMRPTTARHLASYKTKIQRTTNLMNAQCF